MLPRKLMLVATSAVSKCTPPLAQQLRFQCTIIPAASSVGLRLLSSSNASSPSEQASDSASSGYDHRPSNDKRTKQEQRPQHGNDDQNTPTTDATTTTTRRNNKLLPRNSEKKKWRAPFWLPPSASHPSSNRRNPRPQQQNRRSKQQQQQQHHHSRSPRKFRNERLPCRQHLDPHGKRRLPESDWVQLFGALPMTSLEEVLGSVEDILQNELTGLSSNRNNSYGGVIDLDADWNPVEDGNTNPPLVPEIIDYYPDTTAPTKDRQEYALDEAIETSSDASASTEDKVSSIQIESFRVIKAHVVLSPFGRPTGWNLRLANPSMVNALLSEAHSARVRGSIRIGWRFAKVREHHPSPSPPPVDSKDTRTLLVVDDSMVRFENCPSDLTEDYLRHLLSRYELTTKGSTVIKWRGMTDDGKAPPLTYVVRFASPAYARAAVREMQGNFMKGQPIKLIQYPKQLL